MTRKRSSLCYLTNEEAITAYLEPIEEEEETEEFRFQCLETAIRARAINQLAEKTGIDRDQICEMFISGKLDLGITAKLQEAFAVAPKAAAKELAQV